MGLGGGGEAGGPRTRRHGGVGRGIAYDGEWAPSQWLAITRPTLTPHVPGLGLVVGGRGSFGTLERAGASMFMGPLYNWF